MAASPNGASSLGLLLAARSSDPALNERLIVACEPEIQARVAREMAPGLRAVMDPEDVGQEVLRTVCRKIARTEFANVRALRGWLRTLVRHRLVDLVRRHLKTRGNLTRASSLEEEACDASRVLV